MSKCYKETIRHCAECPEYDSTMCIITEKIIEDATEIDEDCPLDDY